MGTKAFGGADVGTIVQTCTFVLGGKGKGNYLRLVDLGESENKRQALIKSITTGISQYYYSVDTSDFKKIPGHPLAYWASSKFISIFERENIGKYAISDGQTKTGNNDVYLRNIWEVDATKIGARGFKWVKHVKGGSFRKWYGNIDTVIDWSDSAREHYRTDRVARITPEYLWFRTGLSWTLISEHFSIRILPNDCTFNLAAPSLFFDDESNIYPIIGYLNSIIAYRAIKILNPTFNTNIGDICVQPADYLKNHTIKVKTSDLVIKNIYLSKADWDSFETSWDFKRHPLLTRLATGSEVVFVDKDNNFGSLTHSSNKISNEFNAWKEECDSRFNQLKNNEEELNRIFIDFYGLQDELTPEEDDSDVTVRKADLPRDIKSLISYAVGCMFGRYSLDEDGLVYAGGTFDMNRYHSFIPDNDNVLPITDEKYLDDDIIQRFCDWISVVYGKDTLEENLNYISKALGNKEGTSRECIRNYFLNEFFKDHCSTYSVTGSGKRPIYWLFDSGKQNAFKALVYMHRWDENTIGRVRLYTHEIQSKYETEMKTVEADINQSTDNRQIARDEKRLDHLKKQVVEIKEYDEKLEHLAAEHITIDLDDGVKVNYEKVQTDRNGKKYQILAPIK